MFFCGGGQEGFGARSVFVWGGGSGGFLEQVVFFCGWGQEGFGASSVFVWGRSGGFWSK